MIILTPRRHLTHLVSVVVTLPNTDEDVTTTGTSSVWRRHSQTDDDNDYVNGPYRWSTVIATTDPPCLSYFSTVLFPMSTPPAILARSTSTTYAVASSPAGAVRQLIGPKRSRGVAASHCCQRHLPVPLTFPVPKGFASPPLHSTTAMRGNLIVASLLLRQCGSHRH